MPELEIRPGNAAVYKSKKNRFIKKIISQKALLLMALPIFIYVYIISYRPIKGLLMAFQNYRPGKTEQKWVGWKNFEILFKDEAFVRIIRNTLCMSTINLILGFFFAILLALLINEIKHMGFKKVVQSASYLPHFLSWIIVTGLVSTILSTDGGLFNDILMKMGLITGPVHWLGKPNLFWGIVGAAHVWKEMGWDSIIYLAAITGISPELYEAAYMDGASRFQKIRYITLPGIKSTFIVLLILRLGWILNAGFEVQFLLGNNGMVLDVSQTIDIFVLRNGISLGNYSLATAAGMFKSVVSLIMLTSANYIASRLGEEKLV